MIKHRCPNCRTFLRYETTRCQCGNVITRKDIWFMRVIGPKRYTKHAGIIPKQEADILHGKWLDELFEPPAAKEARITIEDALSVYLDYLDKTGSKYGYDVKRFVGRLIKVIGVNTLLTEITAGMCREFQRRIVNAGAALSTADRHVAMCKAMFSYVLPDHPNPFKRVDMFHPDNTVVRMLTPIQETRLLDAAKTLSAWRVKWIYHYIVIALNSGMRKNNITHLAWPEVDVRNAIFSVRQKGNKRLILPMSSVLVDMIAGVEKQSEWLFPNPQTGKPYLDFHKTWVECKRLAEIPMEFRFHDLRHHVATKLAKETRNPLLVQTILGHSDLRVTQKYMHAFSSDVRDAIETLIVTK